ncbi:hypothetical protein [Streptomyces sp. NPDC003032]
MRLAEFLSTYSADARQEATAPTVEDGPLAVEAGRIEIVTTGSIMPLRCPRQHTDRVRAVRADGPRAALECEHGHVLEFWQLEPARLRLAVARATGKRPSVQGTHQVEKLLIVSPDAPRHSDPHRINVFLQTTGTPLFGRDDIVKQLGRLGQ